MADLPVADALRRLVAEGLTRHEAVHAVGGLVARHLFPALDPNQGAPDLDQYYAEVSALTAEAWLRSADDDAPSDGLFTEEDRVPRDAVDDVVARGPHDRETGARARADIHLPKVGRNEPCPCGSGRKYKKCCLGA